MRQLITSHKWQSELILGTVLCILMFCSASTYQLLTGGEIVPRYLNKTVTEQEVDFRKAIREMTVTCQKAGGVWVGGIGCSVTDAPKADLSWYVPPIPNPWWSSLEFASGFGSILLLCGTLGFWAVGLSDWEEAYSDHKVAQQFSAKRN